MTTSTADTARPPTPPGTPRLPCPAGHAWPLPDRPPRPAVEGVTDADVTVVGGGLAGLSTALHLRMADPQLRVVVLEAGTVASGASGRGTGLLGPRTGPPLPAARKRYGDAVARRMHQLSVQAVRLVLDLVDGHGIDCGLRPSGQLLVARDRSRARALSRQAAAYRDLGLTASLADRRALESLFAGRYRAALRAEPAATVDPAALTRGLAAVAERYGVVIRERSPVTGLDSGARHRLRLPTGRVDSHTVVIATNAYQPPGLPAAGVVPLEIQAVATAPVTDTVLELLGWHGREAIIEDGLLPRYFRLTPDNRIIAGGGRVQHSASTSPARAERLRRRTWRDQERSLRGLHPVLATVPVERAWSGHIAITRDFVPVIGPVAGAERIWQVRGWCGHGLAMSVLGGLLVSRAVLGAERDADGPWARGSAPGVPQGATATWLLRRALGVLARVSP
jgi:glycine/D-amino acid oxidase-like deaminating enzyme